MTLANQKELHLMYAVYGAFKDLRCDMGRMIMHCPTKSGKNNPEIKHSYKIFFNPKIVEDLNTNKSNEGERLFANIEKAESLTPHYATNFEKNASLWVHQNYLVPGQTIVIHQQPHYTPFPDAMRYYTRANYFFFKKGFNLEENTLIGDVLSSLDVMKQYTYKGKESFEDRVHPAEVKPLNNLTGKPNKKILEAMMDTYKSQKTLIIDWSEIDDNKKFQDNTLITCKESVEIFIALNHLPSEIRNNYSLILNLTKGHYVPRQICQTLQKEESYIIQSKQTIDNTTSTTKFTRNIVSFFGGNPDKYFPEDIKTIPEVTGTRWITVGTGEPISSPMGLITIDNPKNETYFTGQKEIVKWNNFI